MTNTFLLVALKCSLLMWLSSASCTGQQSGQVANTHPERPELHSYYATLADGSFGRDMLEVNRLQAGQLEQALNVRLYITSITQQRNGAMWFGTNGYGVLHYASDTLTYLSPMQGFMSSQVWAMLEDAKGNLWFATADGLICHKAGSDLHSFTLYTEMDGLPHKDVRSLALDRHGMLWLGTAHGAARLDLAHMASNAPLSIQPFSLPEMLTDDQEASGQVVHSITEDRHGRMWFGSNQGVYVYDAHAGGPMMHLSVQDGLCGDTVRDILEDQQGRIWFATQQAGVCRLDGGYTPGSTDLSFMHMPTRAGYRGRDVTHLYEDVRESVWFSVNGVGTYRWEGDSLHNYFESQSCNSHTFNCTFQDQQGIIWFGGWLGLFRYLEPC